MRVLYSKTWRLASVNTAMNTSRVHESSTRRTRHISPFVNGSHVAERTNNFSFAPFLGHAQIRGCSLPFPNITFGHFTTMDEPMHRLYDLPQELFDRILHFTFTPYTKEEKKPHITKDWKPPSVVQVDRRTRRQFLMQYYNRPFHFDVDDDEGELCATWLDTMPPEERNLLLHVVLHKIVPGGYSTDVDAGRGEVVYMRARIGTKLRNRGIAWREALFLYRCGTKTWIFAYPQIATAVVEPGGSMHTMNPSVG